MQEQVQDGVRLEYAFAVGLANRALPEGRTTFLPGRHAAERAGLETDHPDTRGTFARRLTISLPERSHDREPGAASAVAGGEIDAGFG